MESNRLNELLQLAIDETSEPYTLQEVLNEIDAKQATAFVGKRSVLVCSIHKHHDEISVHAWLGAGSMVEIISKLRPTAEAWAKANGATSLTIQGRGGWARALKKVGYSVDAVTLRKAI